MHRVWIKAMAVWLLIIAAESIHGTLRQLLLAPAIGDFRARQVSMFTAVIIIFLITYSLIRWLGTTASRTLLGIGLGWVVLTVVFELSLGRFLGNDWQRLLSDYDLRQGGLMGFGLLALLFTPLVAARLKGTA